MSKRATDNPTLRRAIDNRVPLVAYETSDSQDSVRAIAEAITGKEIATWDCQRGVAPVKGTWFTTLIQNTIPLDLAQRGVTNFVNMSPADKYAMALPELILRLTQTYGSYGISVRPANFVLIILNASREIEGKELIQALCNARDHLRDIGATIVLMGPSVPAPAELKNDILTIVEDLPSEKELRKIVDEEVEKAEFVDDQNELTTRAKAVPEATREKAAGALLGLSLFKARQTTDLAITKNGIELRGLNDLRWKAIESTSGLEHYEGDKATEGFCSVGGLKYGKEFLFSTVNGKLDIQAIVLLDEGDKDLAAGSVFGDTSRTSQDQFKTILTTMQDTRQRGVIFAGPPGTGKTKLPQALAAECGIPLIKVDMGALKGPYVGQSEQQVRQAMRVIGATTRGKALWILTCNRPSGLLPELRRRFSYALMFFELPDREQLDQIWGIHMRAYGIRSKKADMPNDEGWTGSEVENCCLKAWATGMPLKTAASTIVPISKVDAERITSMRQEANGNYICANSGQPYAYHRRSDGNAFKKMVAALT